MERGVNLAGAEFGETNLPGEMGADYTYNSERSYRYFASQGLTLIRLPLQWERLQPAAFGPLESANLAALEQNVEWARAAGARIILDIHNFGRCYGAVIEGRELADLWRKLSERFQFEPTVYAYGLMNEPHDMGRANWKAISQSALNAIRENGDGKLIMVPGEGWCSACRWPEFNGPESWIADPADNFAYEAHQYFDSDGSGRYRQPYSPVSGASLLGPFADWCRENGARGYLGEYGVPGDDPRWLDVLAEFLTALDAAGMDGTCWAAGEWWGGYPLSVQPLDDFTTPRPQLPVLLKHSA